MKHIAEEAYSNRHLNFVLRENTLVEQVQEAIETLKSSGELVTQKSISKIVKMSIPGLQRYPRVQAILDRIADEYRKTIAKHIQKG